MGYFIFLTIQGEGVGVWTDSIRIDFFSKKRITLWKKKLTNPSPPENLVIDRHFFLILDEPPESF